MTDLHQVIIQTEMGITVTTTSFKDTNKRNASTRSKKIICSVMHKEANWPKVHVMEQNNGKKDDPKIGFQL